MQTARRLPVLGFFINKIIGKMKENYIHHSFAQKHILPNLGKASKINKMPVL
jgi:hypothetical protein